MEASDNNKVCKAHSGFKIQIKALEEDVKSLWNRWDRITTVLYLALGGIIINILILVGGHFIQK